MTLAALLDQSRKNKEDWKYTDLEKLLASSRQSAGAVTKLDCPADDKAHIQIIFLNGDLQKNSTSLPFSLTGDLQSGYKLNVSGQACLVAQPIEFVFATSEKALAEIAIKIDIDIGHNASLTLLERHLASNSITTLDCKIKMQEHAKFLHGKIVEGGAHLATTQAHIDAGAYYNNFALLTGGSPARNEIDAHLQGAEAQATLNGIMLGRGAEHIDTTTRIRHLAPNCESRQVYKTVLADKAHGVFQGKIIVAPDAQKSDGYQLSRALLLSDQAEMNAKPELEILADDVKCSHGSTIGDLDEDALFYLRARGLNEAQARALLITAFIGEIIDEVRVEEWKDIFRRTCEGWHK